MPTFGYQFVLGAALLLAVAGQAPTCPQNFVTIQERCVCAPPYLHVDDETCICPAPRNATNGCSCPTNYMDTGSSCMCAPPFALRRGACVCGFGLGERRGEGCDGLDNDCDGRADECDEDEFPPEITVHQPIGGPKWLTSNADAIHYARSLITVQDDCQREDNIHLTIEDLHGKCKGAHLHATAMARCWDHRHGAEAHYVWGPNSTKVVPLWFDNTCPCVEVHAKNRKSVNKANEKKYVDVGLQVGITNVECALEETQVKVYIYSNQVDMKDDHDGVTHEQEGSPVILLPIYAKDGSWKEFDLHVKTGSLHKCDASKGALCTDNNKARNFAMIVCATNAAGCESCSEPASIEQHGHKRALEAETDGDLKVAGGDRRVLHSSSATYFLLHEYGPYHPFAHKHSQCDHTDDTEAFYEEGPHDDHEDDMDFGPL